MQAQLTAQATGQANLWRSYDAALVARLLKAWGVGPDSERVSVFAQCMVRDYITAAPIHCSTDGARRTCRVHAHSPGQLWRSSGAMLGCTPAGWHDVPAGAVCDSRAVWCISRDGKLHDRYLARGTMANFVSQKRKVLSLPRGD